ncbi:hypothetical protein QCA50_006229 [Cerrena zonata]|uniref:Uncharacterized protein n=1 Tax=Cerrena zonata TaxID=2478898 RepID=A0AAW0GNN8_9APHY
MLFQVRLKIKSWQNFQLACSIHSTLAIRTSQLVPAVAVAAAVGNGGNSQALTEILATSGSPTFSRFGYSAPPGGEFIMEEKEGPSQTAPGMQMWINGNGGEQRPMHAMPLPPPQT